MSVSKILFYISWLSSLYFIFLALNHYVIKSRFILIGVVQELITVPLIFGQLAICVMSLIYSSKKGFKFKEYSFLAFLISLVNILVIVGTFLAYGQ